MPPRGPFRHLRRHGHHLGSGHGAKFGHDCGPRHGHGHGFGHHGRHEKNIGFGLALQQSDLGHCQRHIIRGHGPKYGGVKNMRCHGNFLRELLSRVEVVDSEAGFPCCGTRYMHPHARPHYESEETHDGGEVPQHGQGGHPHSHGGPHHWSRRHHHEHGRPHHGPGKYHGPGRHHHGPNRQFPGIGRLHPHGECTGCKYSQEPGRDSQGMDGQGETRPDVSNGRMMRRRKLFHMLQEILRDGPCCEQHNTPNAPSIPPPNTNEPTIGNTETSAPSNLIEQPTKTQGKGGKV